MIKEIEKLKYQMSLLIRMVDSDKYPVESMILYFNWNDEDLNQAHDIFEKYDNKIEAKEEDINWSAFEHELKSKFNIGYQDVKVIVNAFYANHQWQGVCYQYAKTFTSIEFHSLIRDAEQYMN
jgi:hypothetical protein